jgi:hypothetical protein
MNKTKIAALDRRAGVQFTDLFAEPHPQIVLTADKRNVGIGNRGAHRVHAAP